MFNKIRKLLGGYKTVNSVDDVIKEMQEAPLCNSFREKYKFKEPISEADKKYFEWALTHIPRTITVCDIKDDSLFIVAT